MKKKYMKLSYDGIIGTSFIAYIRISYHELVKILGKPHRLKNDKSLAEWSFIDKRLQLNTTAFTIYDYKLGEGLKKEDITEWHIGGFHSSAIDSVHELFPYKRITTWQGEVKHKEKYVVKVAFGSAMSDKAAENEVWFMQAKPDGNEIVEKIFDTMAEAQAFIDGLELASGWLEECHMIL